MPNFTKTRMVYYDNNINILNAANRDTNITISNTSTSNDSSGYGIARIKGSVHNWSTIPFNKYGLYLSINELYYLYNSSSKIIPKNIRVCLGHCVPIAKYPGTTNTTQLSFNNTIYSIIYELQDITNITTAEDFGTTDFTNFRQTYDGASYSDNSRSSLPKNDLLYKFPDYITSDSKTSEGTTIKIASTATSLPTSTTLPESQDGALTRKQVAYQYTPEFLKDNNNVYVLYPGENQYEYDYNIGESDFVCIDTNSLMFNEASNLCDIRGGYHMNSDTKFKGEQHLYQEVCPRVRYNGFIVEGNQSNGDLHYDLNTKRYNDLYYNQDTGAIKDHGPPKLFIKGNPILDDSNNLVSHTFQALITWSIDLDVIPRIEPIPRSLQEGFVVLRHETYRTAGAATVEHKTSFTQPYPLKPQSQTFKNMPSARNRLIWHSDPNVATYSSSVSDNGTWEYNAADWHRGSGPTNLIKETENFNKTTMPSLITVAMDTEQLPQKRKFVTDV